MDRLLVPSAVLPPTSATYCGAKEKTPPRAFVLVVDGSSSKITTHEDEGGRHPPPFLPAGERRPSPYLGLLILRPAPPLFILGGFFFFFTSNPPIQEPQQGPPAPPSRPPHPPFYNARHPPHVNYFLVPSPVRNLLRRRRSKHVATTSAQPLVRRIQHHCDQGSFTGSRAVLLGQQERSGMLSEAARH